jgi:hypothetical protein
MRKYLVLLLFLSTALAQAFLGADCDIKADQYGFVDLYAYAGIDQNNNISCDDVNVTVTVNNNAYPMDRQVTCEYLRLLQLPAGEYVANFSGVYPGDEHRQVLCPFNITSVNSLSLVVYGIRAGDVFRQNASAHIEAVGVVGNHNVDANITAKLISGNTILNETNLTESTLDLKVGDLLLNAPIGDYTIRVTAKYLSFIVQKDYNITISQTQVQNVSAAQLNLLILEPTPSIYPKNFTISLQAAVQDESQNVVTGAIVRADIYKDEAKVASVSLQPSDWYYKGSYLFRDVGVYRITYYASKGYSTINSSVTFLVGSESELLKTANFSVKILSPASSVYMRDSVLTVIAKLTKNNEPVTNASVILLFEGQQIIMAYDRFGQYKTSIGPLSDGTYKIKVVATQDTYIAQAETTFMISESILNIDTISPYLNQELEMKKGDALPIQAVILDEDRDIVAGAAIVAKILDPNGKEARMQLFQDEVTGEYSGNFYLDEVNGGYSLTIEASKMGYVPETKNSQFSIQFTKEQIPLFGNLNTETLLTIVLVVAIVILLAALLRAFF